MQVLSFSFSNYRGGKRLGQQHDRWQLARDRWLLEHDKLARRDRQLVRGMLEQL